MMLDFSTTRIGQLAIHRVGNRQREEGYFLSKKLTDIHDDEAHDTVLRYFTGQFKQPEFYRLAHTTGVEGNAIYRLVQKVFEKQSQFLAQSGDAARLLYDQTTHPKVNGGELFVAYLNEVIWGDEVLNGVGFFKSENKTAFMKVLHHTDVYDFELEEGINLNDIDKACIVLNTQAEDGYRVCLFDRQAKGEEARYWKDDFLGLSPCADSYHQTRQLMSLCKTYITEKMPQEFEVDKTDQIDMLNKSVNFFKANEQFDYQSFTREVMQEPQIMNSFGRYKEEFEAQNALPLQDGFDISAPAVKSGARVFKSVLKLDKNFHIYVHGNKEMIERGYDEERGLSYYKVFFREES